MLAKWLNEDGLLPNAKMVFDAAAMGDAEGVRLLEDYIRYLAVGVSNCILTLRPERVVLGGGISAAGDALFIPLNREVERLTYGSEFMELPRAIPAQLGNDAGIIGAACLA